MADPNALYSYQGQEPHPLPHEIHYTEAWGGTNFRQGVESFTDEELERAGYTGPYTIPNFNQEYQRVSWDSTNLSFVVEDISEEELWDRIRRERNRLLSESDWTMVADAPGDLNLKEWEKYRQRLRDLPSLYSNSKDVIFPISPNNPEFTPELEPSVESKIRWRIEDIEGGISQFTQYHLEMQNRISDLESKIV